MRMADSIQPSAFDVGRIREDFPALEQSVRGRPLVYLDNAATTQKPRAVIDAISRHYTCDYSNVHRGVHYLSERATEAYEGARETLRGFVNARQAKELVFVRGTTEAINLVAQSWGRSRLGAGDEILITAMEHHSNIVPWQLLCEQTGARLKVAPVSDEGELSLASFQACLTDRTRLVSITHVSNALGTVLSVEALVRTAHDAGAKVLVDGAQAVPHMPVDVQALDCDFYAFSGHKMFGPTGIGVLYGKSELLAAMPPYQGGGEMIRQVSFERSTYADIPHKFEAGTPHIVGAIGLGAAAAYMRGLDWRAARQHEQALLDYATEAVGSIDGIRLIGTAEHKAGVLSFVFHDIHAHDVGTIVDQQGVAVRVGHHCTMPLMERMGVPATVRASFALYNTRGEVDALVKALQRVKEVFGDG